MGWESSGVVGFDLGPLLQGQMRTAKLKSAYNSLIIGPRGFGALSLRWIQFASVLRCARSSYRCKWWDMFRKLNVMIETYLYCDKYYKIFWGAFSLFRNTSWFGKIWKILPNFTL